MLSKKMKIENRKKFIYSSLIITIIFFLDRFTKIYILSLSKTNSSLDIFVSKYLNIYLIWNEGIAFGLLSFDQSNLYNAITDAVWFYAEELLGKRLMKNLEIDIKLTKDLKK